MGKTIWVQLLFLSLAVNASVNPSNAQNAEQKKAECQLARDQKTFGTWLPLELKNLGFEAVQATMASKKSDLGSSAEFIVDGQTFPAALASGNIGEFKDWTGNLIDAGRGTFKDVSTTSLEPSSKGAIWLVEVRADVFPSPLIPVSEAKAHGAKAVVLYGEIQDGDPLDKSPLPLFTVSKETAQKIKNKGPLHVKATSPDKKTVEHFAFKAGTRDLNIVIWADVNRCDSVAGLLDGLSSLKGGKPFQGMFFVLTSDPEDFRKSHPEIQNLILKEFFVETQSEHKISDQVAQWRRADQFPETLFNTRAILARALQIPIHLRGIVDGDNLRRFSDNLRKLSTSTRSRPLGQNFQVYKIFNDLMKSSKDDSLSAMARDYKTLVQLHDEIQRGHWEKARSTCKTLSSFWWVDNVETTTFAECQKYTGQTGIDPQIWILLQGGKANLEPALKLLEADIEVLEKRINENFSRLEKNIDTVADVQPPMSAKIE